MRWLRLIGYRWQAYDKAGYLPDYYSRLWHVAVEIDGSIHKRKEVRVMDKAKDKRRRHKGIYTLRLSDKRAQRGSIFMVIEIVLTSALWFLWSVVRL